MGLEGVMKAGSADPYSDDVDDDDDLDTYPTVKVGAGGAVVAGTLIVLLLFAAPL